MVGPFARPTAHMDNIKQAVDGNPGAPYNPAVPGLAPHCRRLFFACSDLIRACYLPVPGLLTCLFRALCGPQPYGCKGCNALTLQGFLERSADCGEKNRLLAGETGLSAAARGPQIIAPQAFESMAALSDGRPPSAHARTGDPRREPASPTNPAALVPLSLSRPSRRPAPARSPRRWRR